MFGNCVSCFCCLWCRRSKTWIYGSRFLDDWRHDGAFPGWRTFNLCSRRRKLYCKPFSRGKEANQRYSDGYDHFHLCVAVIYGIVAVVAAGVLPVEQVAGENLSIVAKEILSGPVYVFFMFCGAGFALISTLNSQFAWAPKPIMQACDDGCFLITLQNFQNGILRSFF